MKTIAFLCCLFVVADLGLPQVPPLPVVEPATNMELAQQVGPPGEGTYAVTEAGPHHRVWARNSAVETPDGVSDTVISSYIELGTGMNVWSDAEQTWKAAKDEIEVFEEAAVARQTQHKVVFAANLRDKNGTVDLLTRDGQRLRSAVVGLAYTEMETGRSVFIAEVKDTQGMVVGENQVFYFGAFDSVRADVRYTTRRSSFEADVVLRESPHSPEAYGLDSATTRLEIWTEFLEAPEPRSETLIRRRGSGEEEADAILGFGAMQMVTGKAFMLANPQQQDQIGEDYFVVTKEWRTIDGHTFLIESLPYSDVKTAISGLPKAQAKAQLLPSRDQNRRGQVSGRQRTKPVSLAVKVASPPRPRFIARANAIDHQPGFVLDWTIVPNTSDFTFESKMTYLVQSEVYLTGTTTFEGGAVIKFAKTTNNYVWVGIFGPTKCKTSPYRPLILTALDDNTIGETISGSTGNPTGYYSYYGLAYRNGSDTLSHVKAKYIYIPYSFYEGTSYVLSDAQAMGSFLAIDTYGANAFLRNLLVKNSAWVYNGPPPGQPYASSGHFEHLTVNQANYLTGNSACYITNSLLVSVTNLGTFYGAYNLITNSASAVFQTVGAGEHYLTSNSAYRDAGTTNINSELLAALKQRTTYPPIIVTNAITSDAVWNPQAKRDVDAPDLGYHYVPLDYLVGNVLLTNATLVVTNGVAVAGYNDYAFRLANPSGIIFEGKPDNLNRLGRFSGVQEAFGTNLWKGSFSLFSATSIANPRPEVYSKFTEFSLLDYVPFGNGSLVYRLQDSDLMGGYMAYTVFNGTNGAIYITNTVWSVAIGVCQQLHKFFARNCLIRKVNPFFVNPDVALWEVRDNLFDTVRFFSGKDVANSHNGYVNCIGRLSPNAATDVMLSSFLYSAGPLGTFYHASTELSNKGSRTSDQAGLYHYTTSPFQVKETNSVVDVGFHYPSLLSYDADNGFSGVQGSNHWRYQRTTSLAGLPDASSPDLPSYDPNPSYPHWHYDAGDGYCHIWDTGQHPGNLYDSVRTFVCPHPGLIRVDSLAHDGHYGAGSDGTRARIVMGGAELVGWKQITEGSTLATAIPLNVSSVAVSGGTRIFFQLNRNAANSYDSTPWLPKISYLGPGMDTDWDGIPDLAEDRNGNGLFDGGLGETDWETSDSPVGSAAGLQVWTPLR